MGWACFYQHADKAPPNEDEGKFFLLSKKPKRIIAWVSKAWTTYEKTSLPVFYKETIARILAFEHFRNLIETQAPGRGVTCYSDHLPGIKDTSLSNKGKLSTWKLHETSDLTSIVTTLYKSGPTMSIADPLSRLVRPEYRVEDQFSTFQSYWKCFCPNFRKNFEPLNTYELTPRRTLRSQLVSFNDGGHLPTPSRTPSAQQLRSWTFSFRHHMPISSH
jgi:hypothetical protein